MSKNTSVTVQGTLINISTESAEDYICLTDMVKGAGDDARAADVIKNWLRNRSTIEFLGAWEALYNPQGFKVVNFDHFRSSAGLPTFTLSVSQWIEATGAIGLKSKAGRNGGTYAHKDIAFEFASAISPVFKLFLIKEFQRLKEIETSGQNLEWNVRRVLSKANYSIQTDAVKAYRIPNEKIPADKEWIAYAEEGDVLNIAVFGFTAKQWREANPEFAQKKMNAREFASIHELAVLSNIEGMNAEMIKSGMSLQYRVARLRQIAQEQLQSLQKVDFEKSYKRTIDGSFINQIDKPAKAIEPPKQDDKKKVSLSDFNQKLNTALNYNPKDKDAK